MSSLREIVFDTETTGLHPERGDRIIEFGAIELVDLMPTGRTLHRYIDPMRSVPEEAVRVHGLNWPKLKSLGARPFTEVVDDILEFIGDAPMVAHNATFDFRVMNAELGRIKYPLLSSSRMVDTLAIAKRKFPGQRASLDALCKRFNISLSGREQHNAVIDTQLLAQVYLELRGGRSRELEFASQTVAAPTLAPRIALPKRELRPSRGIGGPSEDELKAHQEFLQKCLKTPIWDSLALAG